MRFISSCYKISGIASTYLNDCVKHLCQYLKSAKLVRGHV